MIMRTLFTALAISLLGATGAVSADEGAFAEGSTAKGKGSLLGEEKALFTGKVVDVLCELTGDCPDNCGGGDRHLGILRDADGVLVLANKNLQAFAGANYDLMAYCGKQVEVDGLLVGSPDNTAAKFYQLQKIRVVGDEKFAKANKWTKEWNRRNPEQAKIKGGWFKKDTRVKALLERDGRLGLGKEADEAFAKENF